MLRYIVAYSTDSSFFGYRPKLQSTIPENPHIDRLLVEKFEKNKGIERSKVFLYDLPTYGYMCYFGVPSVSYFFVSLNF